MDIESLALAKKYTNKYSNSAALIASNTSKLGREWKQINEKLYTILYAKNIFIAGTISNGLKYSYDGINWSNTSLDTGRSDYIVIKDNIFYTVNKNDLYTSVDGIIWKKKDWPFSEFSILALVKCNDEIFISCFESGTFKVYLYKNDSYKYLFDGSLSENCIIYEDGVYYFFCSPRVYKSNDLNVFEKIYDGNFSKFAIHKNKLLIGTYEKKVLASTDYGKTFTEVASSSNYITGCFYDNGLFYYSSENVYRSIDLINWIPLLEDDLPSIYLRYVKDNNIIGSTDSKLSFIDGNKIYKTEYTDGKIYEIKEKGMLFSLSSSNNAYYSDVQSLLGEDLDSSNYGDLKGEKGEAGTDGTDGFSPTVAIDETEAHKHKVTITDKNGDKEFTVEDGGGCTAAEVNTIVEAKLAGYTKVSDPMTQEEYDSLAEIDEKTLYLIKD